MTEYTKQVASGVTAKVASYIASVRYEDLPLEVVGKAKQHILDNLGAMVAALQLDAGKLIVEFARQQPGEESTVIGSNSKTSCITASLANATLGHADEINDIHYAAITQPGCVAVPAALALGEREKADGKAFINAVVLGYDIISRVGRAVEVRLMRKINRNRMCSTGCWGAAAAASCLLGLSKEQVCSALGLVGEQASGTFAYLQEPRHMAKALEMGVAARNGVTAALLAQLGFQGPPDIFEGPDNIFDAFSLGQCDLPQLTRDLGSRYEIMHTSIKKYPVGGSIQAPLEGLFQIMREQKLKAEDMQEIIVTVPQYGAGLVSNQPIPSFNLEHTVALGACYGKVGWEEARSESRLRDPEVLELKGRVRVVGDAELEKGYPRTRTATVEIVTRHGEHHSVTIEIAGDLQKPLPQAQVEEKFLGLASPVLGPEKTREVMRAVGRLEEMTDVRELGKLLNV